MDQDVQIKITDRDGKLHEIEKVLNTKNRQSMVVT